MRSVSNRKDEYQQKVKAQLDKINAQIDELKAKARQVQANTSVEYHSQMEELCAKRDTAQVKFNELQKSSGDAWQEIQTGFESAWNDLAIAFDKACKKFQ
jgi:uncharacterized coiled-coil DUF342 family protein